LFLEVVNIIAHKGSIIDATFVTVDKRHTTKDDNQNLKDVENLKILTKNAKKGSKKVK
jgi:hypothetical protein